MIKNWIETNKQDVLAAGVSDVIVSMPRHRLETLAGLQATGQPTVLASTPYCVKGWSECVRGENFVKVLLGEYML